MISHLINLITGHLINLMTGHQKNLMTCHLADVHLERVGVRVSLVAKVAGERLDAGVGVHVALEVLVLLKPDTAAKYVFSS